MRDCFILGPLTIHIVTRRPNPQGLNPQRHLYWFFWCCWCAAHLPLPIPRVLSELPRECKGSQRPCTWGALSAVSSTWGWKQCGHRLTSAEHWVPAMGDYSRPPKDWIPPSGHCYPLHGRAPRGRRKGNWHAHIPEDNYTLYQCTSVSISVSGNTSSLGRRSQLFMPWDRAGEGAARWGQLWLGIYSSAGVLQVSHKQHQPKTECAVHGSSSSTQHTSCLPFFHIQWIR